MMPRCKPHWFGCKAAEQVIFVGMRGGVEKIDWNELAITRFEDGGNVSSSGLDCRSLAG